MFEMPKVSAEHDRLEALVGRFRGEETLHPMPWSPQGGTAVGECTFVRTLGGFYVQEDYVQHQGEVETYRGHGMIGYDPRKQKYAMGWYDSMGGHFGEPAWGDWGETDLVFLAQNDMGHSRYTYRMDTPDRMFFSIEVSQDGTTWSPYLEGLYDRA